MLAPLQSLDRPPGLVRIESLTQQSGSANFTKEDPERQLMGIFLGQSQSMDSDDYQLEMPGSSHLSPNYLLQPLQTFPEPEPMLWLDGPLGFLL